MAIQENYNFRSSKDILNAIKYITYNSKTGKITRLDRKNSDGSLDKDGYLIIKIKGKQWKAHRLAWAYYYHKSPNNIIDHIDRNKLNNSIINLRDVTQKINVDNINRKPNKDTNIIGVYIDKTKGLKKNIATKYKNKTYRFYSIKEAIDFRKKLTLNI